MDTVVVRHHRITASAPDIHAPDLDLIPHAVSIITGQIATRRQTAIANVNTTCKQNVHSIHVLSKNISI